MAIERDLCNTTLATKLKSQSEIGSRRNFAANCKPEQTEKQSSSRRRSLPTRRQTAHRRERERERKREQVRSLGAGASKTLDAVDNGGRLNK